MSTTKISFSAKTSSGKFHVFEGRILIGDLQAQFDYYYDDYFCICAKLTELGDNLLMFYFIVLKIEKGNLAMFCYKSTNGFIYELMKNRVDCIIPILLSVLWVDFWWMQHSWLHHSWWSKYFEWSGLQQGDIFFF